MNNRGRPIASASAPSMPLISNVIWSNRDNSVMKGFFGLSSHTDLFKKLEWEFSQFLAEPNNPYFAYNFFVTGWHLLEWKHSANTSLCKQIRDQNLELQICEHLAVGAKHFEPTSSKHQSVSDSKRCGVWAENLWAPGVWAEGVWESSLVVTLSGDAERKYGKRVKAVDLAKLVMNYWRTHI